MSLFPFDQEYLKANSKCSSCARWRIETAITWGKSQEHTTPFMNLGVSILYRKPIKQPPNLFSFLSPLSLDVWIYMATAYLGVSVLLFILAKLVKYILS